MSNAHNELVARIAREYTQPEGIAMAIIREAARLLMATWLVRSDRRRDRQQVILGVGASTRKAGLPSCGQFCV